MNHVLKLTLAALLAVAAMVPAHAADDAATASAGAAATVPLTEGEVKKVDQSAGKLTIKHGPLVNLDMPNMTMVFRVKDPAMLDQVKAGDKIRFVADKVDGAYTVVKIEVAK